TNWIGGGSINEARLLNTSKGKFFLKQNDSPIAHDLFRVEVEGLNILRKANCLQIPKVILSEQAENTAFLVLEFIEEARPTPSFWENFGISLANLHRHTKAQFGGIFDNYIGALPQYNPSFERWTDFFIQARLLPQMVMAKQLNRITSSDEKAFERLFLQLPNYFPKEPPALTHGDLWSGNFLCNQKQNVVLIDPAVGYAHREMDIAMTYLFGGFSPIFYQSYQAVFPLAPRFQERLELYQLYYLLVHVTLFGGGYIQSVRNILKKFVGV
ncbi:MAG: fructosamine kinase family protein, partial [Bacteroidota bacterium]